MIDPNSPDAPKLLADRAGTILVALNEMGVRPLSDPTDLLLLSLLPLAIKKIINGDPFVDLPLLEQVLDTLDLTILSHLIYGDEQ